MTRVQHRDAGDGLANALLERMALVRATEETILSLFGEGKVFGTTHTCIGQEAISAALAPHLRAEDFIFCPHRCHGHFISCGGTLELLLGEIMGRASGACGGRGGSQHLHHGNLFASGVQGGIAGNATGAALALKTLSPESIAVVFLGDGTLGEGLVYESLNFAALRQLPILFLLEDNQYAQTTPVRLGVSGSMLARPQAFGIAAAEVTSNDAVELHETFRARVDFVRTARAPFFQVVHTYRLAAHSKGDDHRDPAEIAEWKLKDPLVVTAAHTGADVESLLERARTAVRNVVQEIESQPLADTEPSPFALSLKSDAADAFPSEELTGTRALNAALHAAMESDPRVIVMGEDVLAPYGGAFGVARDLSSRFPERVITTPISEAGIVAWGVGAALAGMRPVVEIMFGDFLTLAADQLLNHAAKYRWVTGGAVEVPLVIRAPMGGGRGYGPTHSQSIEKMFMGIPGLAVVAPSHLVDPGELLRRAIADTSDPVLFIEHKLLYPKPLLVPHEGRIGNFFIRSTASSFPTVHLSLANWERPNAVLITYGGMTPVAMQTAERLLLEYDILADVVVPSLLSPAPYDEMIGFTGDCRYVITLEEGTQGFDWGAEIVAGFCERSRDVHRRYHRITAAASPTPAAIPLERRVIPDAQSVIDAIRRSMP